MMKLDEVQKSDLSSTKEVAAFMGISYMQLYRLVKCGKIKAVNIAKTGKRVIFAFKPEDIQAYYDHIQDSTKRS